MAIWYAVRHRGAFGRVVLLVGARDPSEILFREDLEHWRLGAEGLEVFLTVDHPSHSWPYGSGVVSSLIPDARLDPKATTVFMCGPEVMMHFSAIELLAQGLPADQMYVSMERNMKCGCGFCGHCQIGPVLACKDGPVFRYDTVDDLMMVREL